MCTIMLFYTSSAITWRSPWRENWVEILKSLVPFYCLQDFQKCQKYPSLVEIYLIQVGCKPNFVFVWNKISDEISKMLKQRNCQHWPILWTVRVVYLIKLLSNISRTLVATQAMLYISDDNSLIRTATLNIEQKVFF